MNPNDIGTQILDAAFRVHTKLGPGLLESAYEHCLTYELQQLDLIVERQVPLPLVYHDLHVDCAYRADLIVEGQVIIEVKAVDELGKIHWTQVLTYLKLSKCELGYLINFNVPRLKEGIKRVVLSNQKN